jgi:aspartate aminotransferase
MRVSQAAASLPPSGIRELMELAWAAGDVSRLEVGEPSFPTPPHVVEAADQAARDGWTRYTQSAGVPALREAIAAKVGRLNRYQAAPDQVVVTAGGIEAIYLAMLGVLEPGDEVLLPDPGWPNFRMMARLVHAVERLYPLRPELGFLPAPEDLERAIGPRTRAILLNSPSNPLGAIIGADRLTELLDLAAAHDLWVISDECYDAITFDDSFASPAAVAHPDRVISCYSFSKTYAMTGWRVGYLVVSAGTPPPSAASSRPCCRASTRRPSWPPWPPSPVPRTRSPGCATPTGSAATCWSACWTGWACPATAPRAPSTPG